MCRTRSPATPQRGATAPDVQPHINLSPILFTPDSHPASLSNYHNRPPAVIAHYVRPATPLPPPSATKCTDAHFYYASIQKSTHSPPPPPHQLDQSLQTLSLPPPPRPAFDTEATQNRPKITPHYKHRPTILPCRTHTRAAPHPRTCSGESCTKAQSSPYPYPSHSRSRQCSTCPRRRRLAFPSAAGAAPAYKNARRVVARRGAGGGSEERAR